MRISFFILSYTCMYTLQYKHVLLKICKMSMINIIWWICIFFHVNSAVKRSQFPTISAQICSLSYLVYRVIIWKSACKESQCFCKIKIFTFCTDCYWFCQRNPPAVWFVRIDVFNYVHHCNCLQYFSSTPFQMFCWLSSNDSFFLTLWKV